MSKFLTDLVTKELLGSKYAQLVEPFVYQSSKLNAIIIIPEGFICDYESVPLLKASSKRAGVIHDYLCRKDSKPEVTKQMAATIYDEAQKCRDDLLDEDIFTHFKRNIKRKIKTTAVRIAWGYFHRLPVMAKIEDVSGVV